MSKYVLPAAAAVARAARLDRTVYNGLRPVLVGPRAGLHRYAEVLERAAIGPYDPLADATYAYPGKAVGSTVDLAAVKIFAATADLNYFNKYVGTHGSALPATDHPNRVRVANYVFKTANGVARSADFHDRDVKVGDVVYVRGTGDDTVVYELTTAVTGFVGDPVAADTAAATADANNAATQTLSTSISQVADTPINDVVASVSGAGYESTADGYLSRTYTVTVTQSSTGSDATTGRLRVRSSDGLDDQDGVVPAAFGAPTAIGTKGLTVTFSISPSHSSSSLFGIDEDDLVIGQAWTAAVGQAWTAPVATSAGTYTGARDVDYIVTVTTGGLYAGTIKPRITVTSANGYDRSGPTTVAAAATPVAVGSYGVTVAFSHTGLRKGDVYYVAATAASEGALRTLVLRDDVNVQVRGNEVDVRLFARRTDLEIPSARTVPVDTPNWSADAAGVALVAGIEIVDAEFTDGGDPVPVPLDSADLYVEYREWLAAGTGGIEVVVLTDRAGVAAAFGTVDPDNPIAFAADCALAATAGELLADPTRPAATTTDRVFCIAIDGDPAVSTNWSDALDLVADDDEAYGLVPLSADVAVHALFAAHVAARSDDEVGFYRRCFLPTALTETGAVVSAATTTDEASATGTIAAKPATSPTRYLILTTSGNVGLVAAGVRAGDVLRINFDEDAFGNPTYDSYEVAAVTSQTTLELATGPTAAIGSARQIEIWRTYTKAELVSQLTAAASGYADERVFTVFPDRPAAAGVVLPGHFLCATVAGLTGSIPSHQGVRNVGVPVFDDATRASRFFRSTHLDDMAAGGVMVVSQSSAGDVYVRNAVSTDVSSVATREEMIGRNADMVRKAIQTAWAPYVGSGNTVSSLKELLDGALASLAARLKSGDYPRELGAPVASLSVASIAAVEGQPDAVDVTVNTVGLAVPLNRLTVRLPVSL